MMDEYKAKIDALMKNKEYKQALPLIESELAQPYLPAGFYEQYMAYKLEIKASQSPISKTIDAKRCFSMLLEQDNPLLALSHLEQYALINHKDAIQQVFTQNSDDLICGLLIELLIQQQINHTFVIHKDSLRIEFNPVYVMSVYESDGYKAIETLISEHFENDNPSVMMMANQLLVSESLMRQPLALDEFDVYPIGYSIIKAVLLAVNDEDLWQSIKNEHNIDETMIEKLKSFSTH